MPITITCPHCGTAGSAPDQVAGQTVRCPKCKESFVAGGPAPMSAELDDEDDYRDDEDDRPRKRKRRRGGADPVQVILNFALLRQKVAPLLVIVVYWVGLLYGLWQGIYGFYHFATNSAVMEGFKLLLYAWFGAIVIW